jgi:hypothetical protein
MQLFDLGQRGFFNHATTPDNEFPFAMFWKGELQVLANMQQVFGVGMQFPSFTQPQKIKIVVHSRTILPAIGGYVTNGRSHVTQVQVTCRLITGAIKGIVLPAKYSVNISQPYLVESSVHASAIAGGELNLTVHSLTDGMAETRKIHKENDTERQIR